MIILTCDNLNISFLKITVFIDKMSWSDSTLIFLSFQVIEWKYVKYAICFVVFFCRQPCWYIFILSPGAVSYVWSFIHLSCALKKWKNNWNVLIIIQSDAAVIINCISSIFSFMYQDVGITLIEHSLVSWILFNF